MNMSKTFWLAALAFAVTAATAFAQVPGIIQYQGRVTSNGTNFTGTGQFKFAIIETIITGSAVWNNAGVVDALGEPVKSVPVAVNDGLFIVGLGDTTLGNMLTIPASVFSYENLKLRIWFSDGVGAFAALSPDQKITSVGFAMMAADVANNVITASKLAPEAVTGDKIAPGSVAGIHLLNQTITGAKIAANTITSTEVADTLLLQRLDLGGPLWNGTLTLNALGIGEARGSLTGDGNGSLLNLQFANTTTGAVLSVRSPGAKLKLWDVFGAETALLGAGLGGGELSLFQINGQLGIFLDGDKSIYGNPNPSGAEIEIRNASGALGLLLDGHGTGGGGAIRVMDNASDTATVEILGAETTTTGGRLTLREADGTSSVIVDAENGLNGGARVALTTGSGATTVEIDGAETTTTGGLITLRQADGTVTVKLDAESGGVGTGSRLRFEVGVPANVNDPIVLNTGRLKGSSRIPVICNVPDNVLRKTVQYTATSCVSQEFSYGTYRLPYANNVTFKVNRDHLTHSPSKTRLDLGGTAGGGGGTYPIVAAAAGTVMWIVDNNTTNCGGCSAFNNYVWIRHSNGEWTKYTHFMTGSVTTNAQLTVGMNVAAGRYLGDEGKVGAANSEHLHFEVAFPTNTANITNAIQLSGGFVFGPNRIPLFCDVAGHIILDGQTFGAGPCSGDPCVNDIVLPAKIIRGTEAHLAAGTVDSGNNNISLDTYASLALYAGNKVTLRPGFKALSKSYLRAAIQPCFNPP